MISQAAVVFYNVQKEKLLFVELPGEVSQWKSLFMLHTEDDYQSSGLVEVLQTTRKHAELTGTNLPRLQKETSLWIKILGNLEIIKPLFIFLFHYSLRLKVLSIPPVLSLFSSELIIFIMFRQDIRVYICCRNLHYPSLCVLLALNLCKMCHLVLRKG